MKYKSIEVYSLFGTIHTLDSHPWIEKSTFKEQVDRMAGVGRPGEAGLGRLNGLLRPPLILSFC